MNQNKNKVFLSVVIPAYNEAKRIHSTLLDVRRYFSVMDFGYEVIVVNDGSRDKTAESVRSFMRGFPSLRLINNTENRGKGYAVKCGMLEAVGEYRLFMDADNSVTIDTVELFLEEMTVGGHGVVIGSIGHPDARVIDHNRWYRRFLGSLSKLFIRAVAIPGIYDTQRGFKLFTGESAEKIFPLQQIERFGFDIELLLIARKNGIGIKELPVAWDNPIGSSVGPRAYLDSFVELFKICGNALAGKYTTIIPMRFDRMPTSLTQVKQ